MAFRRARRLSFTTSFWLVKPIADDTSAPGSPPPVVRCINLTWRRSFAEGVAQLCPSRFHLARRLITQQNASQLLPLIIVRDEFFLRVRALKIDTNWQHAEVPNKIHV